MKTEIVTVEAPAPTEALVASTPALTSFSSNDLDTPRLNVLQKMSEIEGPVGSVTVDKGEVLIKAEEKIPVIIAGATKRWKEDIPFDSGINPRYASTEAAAEALANESSYGIIEFAEITLLIPQPKGHSDDLFPYPIGDQNYLTARITVQKDAYRLTYKRLFTFQYYNPTIPVATRLWQFGTEVITKGKYSWYVPTLSITKEEAPAAAVAFAANHARITGSPF